ncbi:hypothetical protein FRC06_009435, partial [Ceratobasidium sp. 370]
MSQCLSASLIYERHGSGGDGAGEVGESKLYSTGKSALAHLFNHSRKWTPNDGTSVEPSPMKGSVGLDEEYKGVH